MKVGDRVKGNCDNCRHAYIMTDTMCFGCNHPTRRYSCMITVPSTCSDFEAGDPCYIGEDKARDGCLLPHIPPHSGYHDIVSDDPLESIRTAWKDWKPLPPECNCKCSLVDKTPIDVLKSCIDLYKAKNKEYQNTDDQFENFTKGAELNNCTLEQALWGYVTKQIVSLASIIQTGKNREKISEKARDIIVYMAILEAMQ